jgi:hypothetical protein
MRPYSSLNVLPQSPTAVIRFMAAALGCAYACSESMIQAKDVEAGEAMDDKKGGGDSGSGITATGLKVLVLLAVQNCSKNLIMRYAVQVRAPRPLRKALHALDIVGSIPRKKKGFGFVMLHIPPIPDRA